MPAVISQLAFIQGWPLRGVPLYVVLLQMKLAKAKSLIFHYETFMIRSSNDG